KKASNYMNGANRRFERAAELDQDAPPEPPVEPPAPLPDDKFPIERIPSNFDTSEYLLPKSIPPSAAPDVVGAFRIICQSSHFNYDDAIVYPGQPGASHLHEYYGNTLVNANSTYETLRTTGDSTCMNPLNRSGYWIPAMKDGKGNVVRSNRVSLYYKRHPKGSASAYGDVVAQPDGLKAIFGFDMLGGPTTGSPWVLCAGKRYEIGEQLPANCGESFKLLVNSQPCWDGVNLDSPDHRSHMANVVRNASTNWQNKCPDTHPKQVPQFTLSADYSTGGEDITDYRLSSDHHAGTVQFGSFHADLWDGWDGPTKDLWTRNCLDLMLNCSDGDTGGGLIMKRWEGFSYTADPRLIPIPERPAP
ncbi:MAG: DUF1996 domain-containing protein, partial [Pseudomonadota bacterium]